MKLVICLLNGKGKDDIQDQFVSVVWSGICLSFPVWELSLYQLEVNCLKEEVSKTIGC